MRISKVAECVAMVAMFVTTFCLAVSLPPEGASLPKAIVMGALSIPVSWAWMKWVLTPLMRGVDEARRDHRMLIAVLVFASVMTAVAVVIDVYRGW